MSILSGRSLYKSFGSKKVLEGINFDLHEKQSFVVIGGSGTGKSVLIKGLLGLLSFDSGDIFIDGKNIQQMSLKERKKMRSQFGMLFQAGALFDSMTVLDNVAFGLIYGMGVSQKEAYNIAYGKIEAVDLDPKQVANIYPSELSGGMQKRIALARAIATNPRVIFFDEPTTGLDPIVSGTINQLIVRCVKDIGASAITITHDMHSVETIGDYVALLFQGQFIWEGTTKDMKTSSNPHIHQFIHGLSEGPFTS